MCRKSIKHNLKYIIVVIVFILVILHAVVYFYFRPSEQQYKNSKISYTEWDNVKKKLPYTGCKLISHDYKAVSVKKTNQGFFAEFENTFFGTLELRFPETLIDDVEIDILLGEIAVDENVWTRIRENKFSGNWVNYYETKVTVPAGSNSFVLKIPERTRIDSKQMPTGWIGGITAFGCCQISGFDGQLTKSSFIQKAVYYPFNDEDFSFFSSNKKLDEVIELCGDTIKATTYSGYFVDGFREIKPYELDAYINTLGWFCISDDPQIARVTLDYLIENHTWPTEWMMYTIFLAYDYYMETGDKEYIQSIFSDLERCVFENETNENGLVDSVYYTQDTIDRLGITTIQDVIDYPPIENDKFDHEINCSVGEWLIYTTKGIIFSYVGNFCDFVNLPFCAERMREHAQTNLQNRYVISSPNAVVNAIYYQSLVYMSELANEIDLDVKKKYSDLSERLKCVYQDSFIGDGKVFDSLQNKHSSLQSCIYALDFGLVPEEQRNAVAEYVERKGMRCSVYASQFFLESLFKNGRNKMALESITSENDTSWLNMKNTIGSKLTTEAWGFNHFSDMDLNHAWSTSPINIVKRFIVGISPETPGYEITSFAPNFFELEYLDSTVPTTIGRISISYRKQKTDYYIHINVPKGMKISFKLSRYDFSLSKIDGVVCDPNEDVIIQDGKHVIELE